MKSQIIFLPFIAASTLFLAGFSNDNSTADRREKIKLSQKQTEELEEISKRSGPELEGFTGLTFWSLPSFGGNQKKTEAFVKKLEKFLQVKGKVVIIDQEKGMDFEGFKTGAIVYLNNLPLSVQDLKTHKGEFLKNIECIRLKVMTPITIQKNGKHKQADIYEESIYIATSEKDEIVEQASLNLISQLLNEFFSANPQLESKAQFFIYN